MVETLLLKLKAFGELAQWLALDPQSGFYLIKDGAGAEKRMRHPMRIRFEKLGRELGLLENMEIENPYETMRHGPAAPTIT